MSYKFNIKTANKFFGGVNVALGLILVLVSFITIGTFLYQKIAKRQFTRGALENSFVNFIMRDPTIGKFFLFSTFTFLIGFFLVFDGSSQINIAM